MKFHFNVKKLKDLMGKLYCLSKDGYIFNIKNNFFELNNAIPAINHAVWNKLTIKRNILNNFEMTDELFSVDFDCSVIGFDFLQLES